MTEAKRLRLFVAVPLPQDLLECVGRAVEEWRKRLPDARWAPPAARHVTLKFLGSTDPTRLEDVREACRAVATRLEPAVVRPAGFGGFPSARRARVLWVGVEDEHALLRRTAAGLDDALTPLGWPSEKRPFHAHLTVARFRSPRSLESLGDQGEPNDCPTFLVRSFALWQSHLSPRGASYSALDDFPLGAS